MLTADLVRARRRGDRLLLQKLDDKTRELAGELAAQYIAIARASVGQTRQEMDAACGEVTFAGYQRRLAMGLLKLVRDRCTFEAEQEVDPLALRREVFTLASARRQASGPGEPFSREAVLEEVAAARGVDVEELERQLFADLRGAHRLLAFDEIGAAALVEAYDLGQAQAVLLRAERVVADVVCRHPGTFRRLFHKLRFLQLLFTVERRDKGYRLVIDGPCSLFRSVTRYGLRLALALPAIRDCDRWEITADVQWGKDRRRLELNLSGELDGPRPRRRGGAVAHLSDEVSTLLQRFKKRKTPWRAEPCKEVLHLPGVGVIVPDLVFSHPDGGPPVYLEVMGYWSREAVWKRVELVEAGLPQRILFAVSSRLRVSEAVLADDLPGALYVYKGALVPGAVEERLDRLAGLD